jgi:integrase
VTVGKYITAAKATADIAPRTLETYCRGLRKIASDILGLVDDGSRYDARGSGRSDWLEQVDSVKLSEFTANRVAEWKKVFLSRALPDPVSQRHARVSVNFYLRSARSLFSRSIIRSIELLLPDPLPFSDVEIERPSAKYFPTFNLERLIETASNELANADPEAFKIFLLSGMAGLRRKEIDLLPWSAFRWDEGVIRIEHTKHFTPKTLDSSADIAVDPELMALFRGYAARNSKAEFVVESGRSPRPGVLYNFYRCEPVFQRLTVWLKGHGVTGAKPLHELRKAFGSAICERAGIHQASRSLRHSDIRVTSQVYVDARSRATVGLGHLLGAKIVEFRQPRDIKGSGGGQEAI